MKFLGLEISRAKAVEAPAALVEQKSQFEDVLQRLIALNRGSVAEVTPETCMRSPTVQAIVTAISNRLEVTPIHVYRRKTVNGRETKEKLENHPVAKLLKYPNSYQSRANFWGDAASTFVRHGNFYAHKFQGTTGPIRELNPRHPNCVSVVQDQTSFALRYRVTLQGGQQEYPASRMLHVRGTAKDYVTGDSPVKEAADAIAMEIAAQQFSLSFFDNGALPLMIFKYMANVGATKDAEAEKRFIADFQAQFGGKNRHRGMLLPKGIEAGTPIEIANDKAQMIESRRYQRTVIAGAFGVPPQYVGDLERATFNNAEQQTIQFTTDVINPVVQKFEAALERDLLTEDDWRDGVVIRFNLDSILRADFKSRQEGLRIQRDAGVISANEWREIEGRNPIPNGKGGDDFMRPANMQVAGEPPPEQQQSTSDAEDQSTARDQSA